MFLRRLLNGFLLGYLPVAQSTEYITLTASIWFSIMILVWFTLGNFGTISCILDVRVWGGL